MLNKKEFSKRLSKVSVNVLRTLIPALGLHKRNEQILILKYVEQRGLWDIAEKMTVTYESASNLLCISREEMQRHMVEDYDILPKDIQILVDKILK